jgi:UDP-glucose 4-epimerase
MRFLVTGGAGFIGSHIAQMLVGSGQEVRVLDDLSYGSLDNLAAVAGRLDFVESDVRSETAMSSAMSGVDCVIHLAAISSVPRSVENPTLTSSVNLLGSLNVLDQARRAGVKRVVVASSAAVYGQSPEPVKTESLAPGPTSPYAADKVAVEIMCRVFCSLYGLETVALRYFNIYGPRQTAGTGYASVIPLFLGQMLQGEPPVIFGDGLQTRDFCYIDDVVQATVLAATSPAVRHGETINIGSGKSITILELVKTMNDLFGANLAPVHAPPRPGDVRHSRADISLATRLLGYSPQVPLATGLARTATWLRERWPRS